MHLTVTCPVCQTSYQVDSGLRGKRIRCPNSICRALFEVTDPTSISPPPPDSSVAPPVSSVPTPSVGTASPTPPPASVEPASPVAPAAPAASREPVAPVPPAGSVGKPRPKPRPPGKPAWATPPPVRGAVPRGIAANVGAPDDFPEDEPPLPASESTSTTTAVAPETAAGSVSPIKTSIRSRAPVLVLLGLVVVLIGVGAYLVQQWASRSTQLELDRYHQAEEIYKKSEFAEAMRRFQDLQRDYPQSKEAPHYRFLAMLSELRRDLDAAHDRTALRDVLERSKAFVQEHRSSPFAREARVDLWETLLPLSARLRNLAVDTPDAETLRLARESWTLAMPFADRPVAREDAEFQTAFRDASKRLEEKTRREELLAFLERAAQQPSVDLVRAAERRVAVAHADPQVAAAWTAVRTAHRETISYAVPSETLELPAADPFAPISLPPISTNAVADTVPVVAITPTGVLYAFDSLKGELRWLRRLGIDSRMLPLRLTGPGSQGWVIVFGDRKTVAMLDPATGSPRWEHPLRSPCSASPTLIGDRLLVPTQSGRIDDLDPETGKVHGSFHLDQPAAAVLASPVASQAIVAGYTHCLYVLDLQTRKCVDILYTGHAGGSLRRTPILAEDALILLQGERGPQVRLRTVPLPSAKSRMSDLVIPGTLSHDPWQDAESLALATDDGKLHLVGRRLKGNTDPPLFPLTPTETAVASTARDAGSASLVVHADAEHVWVLTRSRLHRLRKVFTAKSGPALLARWPQTPWLGEPLHAAEVREDGGRLTLYLATRHPTQPLSWMTAVDAETGRILWKRSLGTVPLGEIERMGSNLVWQDAGGVVFRDSASGAFTPVPLSEDSSPEKSHQLVPKEGKLYHLSWIPTGRSLVIREIDPVKPQESSAREVTLPARPAGLPAVLGDAIIIPLSDGLLARVELAAGQAVSGPDWRSMGAERESLAHVTGLDGESFVTTDGRGGLIAFRWNGPKGWSELGKVHVPDRRLVAVHALAGTRVLALDDQHQAHLFDSKSWRVVSRSGWDLKGRVTTAPVPAGSGIVLLVDRKRLVRIDPERDGITWEHAFPVESVGPPRVHADRILSADIDGSFWVLDASTGRNLAQDAERPTLSVQANLAVAAAPRVLAEGSLFVLWSDGTAGVLPSEAWQPKR